MSSYDRWLSSYDCHPAQAWCKSRNCPNHEDSITVMFEAEFGQGTITPEECPLCGGALTLDQPKGEDDDQGDTRA